MKEKDDKKIAVALKYDEDEDIAPKVVAKGEGLVADKIIEKASEHNISIYEDRNLAKQLKNLEINEMIPRELYEAVAQVLVFIAQLDSK